MKNITVSIDDDTHHRARVRAAELGTSVSALVKAYLAELAQEPLVPAQDFQAGVRDMQISFTSEPASIALPLPGQSGPEGQPYCINGKWTFTKDGKPRKPGALRGKLWVADDFDEWPEDILASFEAWPYDDPDYQGWDGS